MKRQPSRPGHGFSAWNVLGPLVLSGLTVLSPSGTSAPPDPSPRPNILWITCEDMSPNLGCYGDSFATTPHLDRFAQQSVRYAHAYATAPVCSPARSCLITGLYATSLNTHNLRSSFPIPVQFKGFPAYLRQRGYFCSNNVKTDYNTRNEPDLIKEAWDQCSAQAHWRQRKSGQPFFSVFNLMETHQSRSSVWSFEEFEEQMGRRLKPNERHDPAQVTVPPYYPDTPIVRRTLARYYDCITAMDKEAGRILQELDTDGLAGNTIVFFYSDHGAGLPRAKRLLHDSGMRVPLLIRFPDPCAHLAPAPPGHTVERLVSFVDFAPTVLRLAEVPVPAHMQGQPFLGRPAAAPRRFVHGSRDRVDEAFDLSRSVRDARYLYIRNYMPHLSWNQPEGYSDNAAMRREITRLAGDGKLQAAQLTYAGPGKPREELYDTQTDIHQIRNLASSPAHRDALKTMRRQLERWSAETRDLGYLPECESWERAPNRTPWEMARNARRYPQKRIRAAADLVGRPDAVAAQIKLLRDSDSAVRYWAAVGLSAAGQAAAPARAALGRALPDEAAPVRIAAAGALLQLGETESPLAILTQALQGTELDAVLLAARTLQLSGKAARPALPAMKQALSMALARENELPQYLSIRFSLEAALRELGG